MSTITETMERGLELVRQGRHSEVPRRTLAALFGRGLVTESADAKWSWMPTSRVRGAFGLSAGTIELTVLGRAVLG